MPDESSIDQRGARRYSASRSMWREMQPSRLHRWSLSLTCPPPPRDFTGREEELQDLMACFDRGATITGLRGMGGIGKTALAYALAEKLTDRYPDGQILIELRGTSPEPMTPAEAMARVVRAYHPEFKPPESEAEIAGIYHSLLHDLHVLLLLDNAADDRQVRPMLSPTSCGVIVTSRRKFSLPGLVAKDLDLLKMDKAVELLLKSWKPEASPSFEPLEDENLNEIARLCGYLPLALRAAGSLLANSSDLSPAQYACDLQDERQRLERIGREGVDLDVESSFGLSYSRLRPETAAVFSLLSIFPANFDATAEEVICQDEGHRHLSELMRGSLVEYERSEIEGAGRYHLHDLVRIFAAYRLQARKKAEAEQRHAAYYRNVLSISNGHFKQGKENLLVGLGHFDTEWTNIQAGQAWAEKNLQVCSSAADLCNTYPNSGVYVLDLRLHPRIKIRWLETALAAARQLGNRDTEGSHLGNLGNAYAALGDAYFAIDYYEQALEIAHEIGDRRIEGTWLGNLGNAYYDLGDARQAIRYYEQGLAISCAIGDQRTEGTWLGNLGLAYDALGDARHAIDYYKQAIGIAHEIGDLRVEGNAIFNMSLALKSLGKRDEAVKLAEDALQIYERIESPYA